MELIEAFIQSLQSGKNKHSKITLKNYRADIRKFIIWYENTFKTLFNPRALNNETINNYFASFPTETSIKSIKRYQSSLKKFFDFLKAENLIQENPLAMPVVSERKKPDEWRIKEFKNHLMLSGASTLTIKNYLSDIRQFVHWFTTVSEAPSEPKEGAKRLSQLTTQTIEEYKRRLLHEAHLSPLSINRKLSSLRRYLQWLQDKGIINSIMTVPEAIVSPVVKEEPIVEELPVIITSTPPPTLEKLREEQHAIQKKPKKEASYSRVAPVRFFQKTGKLFYILSDWIFFLPIAKLIESGDYLLWKMGSKDVFAPVEEFTKTAVKAEAAATQVKMQTAAKAIQAGTSVLSSILQTYRPNRRISNIPKSVYAPLSISTKALPWKQRILHHLKHTRPAWYRKYHSYPIVHYFHIGILVVFMTGIGVGMYQAFVGNPRSDKPIMAAQTSSPPRQLAYQGTLTDAANNPITAETPLRFSIYNSPTATGAAMLWEEIQKVNPDENGKFLVFLGKNNPLKQQFFVDNTKLYLGLTVKSSDEMLPRQQLSNVSYANNSDTVQGMNPITAPDAGTKNVLLALDSSGNLTIGDNSSPTFQATGGEFTLSGRVLTLATNQGSNSNVQIKPDGSGIIDMQKPIQNTSNNNNITSARGAVEIDDMLAVLATSSGQSAFTVNQNGNGPLISASSSGIAKFTVSNDGSGMFAGNLSINGNSLSSTSKTFNLLDTGVADLNIGGSATSISLGNKSGMTTINSGLNVAGSTTLNGGATIPKGKSLNVSGVITSDLIPSETGKFNLGSETAYWKNAYIDNIFASSNASTFGFWTRANNTLSPTDTAYNLSVGGSITFGMKTADATSIGVCKSTTDGTSTGTELRECNGTPGDIAEYYPADEDLYPGELVAIRIDKGKQMISKSIEKYQKTLISVVSTYPVGQFGKPLSSDTINKEDKPTAIGLVGKVPLKVSKTNGDINPGDPITASDIPGVGMKATQPGRVIGYALESYNGSTQVSDGVQQQESLRSKSLTKFNNDPKAPEPGVGKILVYLNPTWNNPDLDLTAQGDLHIKKDENGKYAVQSDRNESITSPIAAATGIIGTLEAGLIEAQDITTNSLTISTENVTVGGETLKDYIAGIVKEILDDAANKMIPPAVSPIASADMVQTKAISPLGDDSEISMHFKDKSIEVHNASGSAVASIDNQGNASFSGTLRAKKIIADEIEGIQTGSGSATYITNNVTNHIYNSIGATPSGILASTSPAPTPEGQVVTNTESTQTPDITAKTDLQTTFADIATFSAGLNNTPLATDTAKFQQGIAAFGSSIMGDTAVTGQLSVGGNMIMANSSINTIGSDLEIQPLRQGNLSIMGGLIAIDTDGNLTVKGNATFAKNLTVKGRLAAGIISPINDDDLTVALTGKKNSFVVKDASGSSVLTVNQNGSVTSSGSGRFKDVATNGFQIIRGVQADTSLTETHADGSAGSAIITAYERERTIFTPYVKQNSLIYITATSNTQGVTPYIARQTAEDTSKKAKGSFTIQIPQEVGKDITVNWWIVN